MGVPLGKGVTVGSGVGVGSGLGLSEAGGAVGTSDGVSTLALELGKGVVGVLVGGTFGPQAARMELTSKLLKRVDPSSRY